MYLGLKTPTESKHVLLFIMPCSNVPIFLDNSIDWVLKVPIDIAAPNTFSSKLG